MWGRAGRRGRGLAVYVAGEDALDQFFCRHPDEFLDRPVEAAILDPENPDVLAGHLLCAAHEAPLEPADDLYFGRHWRALADHLVAPGVLRERPAPQFLLRRADASPAGAVPLRSAGEGFAVVDQSSGELLGTVDGARAFSTLHEGAIYLHGGRSYEAARLDLETGNAFVKPFGGDFYTQPKKETSTEIEAPLDRKEVLGVTLWFGRIRVTEQVVAFQRKRLSDHEVVDLVPLDLPMTSFSTQALWY